jgi:hypothetical protein
MTADAAKSPTPVQRAVSTVKAFATEKLDLHVVAALIMVAISVFGAVAAFRVALAEQRSVALERRLALHIAITGPQLKPSVACTVLQSVVDYFGPSDRDE